MLVDKDQKLLFCNVTVTWACALLLFVVNITVSFITCFSLCLKYILADTS